MCFLSFIVLHPYVQEILVYFDKYGKYKLFMYGKGRMLLFGLNMRFIYDKNKLVALIYRYHSDVQLTLLSANLVELGTVYRTVCDGCPCRLLISISRSHRES